MNLVEKAKEFATLAHEGQYRWDGVTPYITHPEKVVNLLKGMGISDENMLAAAWLHDVLEDTGYKLDHEFPVVVVDIVKSLSHGHMVELEYIKHCSRMLKPAAMIKICDIMANLGDLKDRKECGDQVSPFVRKRFKAMIRLLWRVLSDD